MQFEPKNEKQLAENRPLHAGVFQFEILEAWEKISAAGNPMFEIRVQLSNGNGVSRTLPDYLLPKGVRAEKLLHCCIATGMRDKYDSGLLSPDDFVGKRGRLRVGIEKKKGFPDRNQIEDYLAA
jgi:hypothetical protein